MNTEIVDNQNNLKKWIMVVSIIIPLAVAFLIFMPSKIDLFGNWVKLLPTINATINSCTALFLVLAVIMVSKGNIQAHRFFMSIAFVLGAIFLVSYIIYHASVDSTVYGDINGDGNLSPDEELLLGNSRNIYLFVLLSHIILSIVVVPFVLMSFYYSLTDKIAKHKRIVKYTFPIWLYVSVTGVITFFLISPYYK
jgi:putative membrane protein